ncbi:hypothetical protein RMATCC62417_10806 [Rhizopus microsporus]|nr:hypothetical protein RMATCC62417_10806 [Rhizopus microsporus]
MSTEFNKLDMKKPLSTTQDMEIDNLETRVKANTREDSAEDVVERILPGVGNPNKIQHCSKKLSSFRNGEETCLRSCTQVFRTRSDREISFPRRSAPIQLVYDPGERQGKTYLGLQTDQRIHSVSALQDGGSASTSRNHRDKRLYCIFINY